MPSDLGDETPNDESLLIRELRDHSRSIRDDDVETDFAALADDLDRLADSIASGALWQCQIQTPFAEIYAVGVTQGGPLQYRCRHNPYHTFSG